MSFSLSLCELLFAWFSLSAILCAMWCFLIWFFKKDNFVKRRPCGRSWLETQWIRYRIGSHRWQNGRIGGRL
jgi:hypothetical protein